MANRFLYLSLTGSAVLFALACGWLLDRVGVLRIPLLAVLAIIAALGAASISTATADFGENARVSRVPFRNVSQAHPNLPADTLLYFVYPSVPGSNLSGMFLWRYGPQVTVLASDIGRPAGLREHATAYVIYFDEQGNQKEVRVSKEIFARSSVALPADLAQSIRLQGMELANGLVTGGQSILLFTYWSALKRMETDYVISVNLVSVQNDVVARYSKAPHRGDAPTSGWTPGEPVTDVVQLPVPAETPPGVYWLQLSLVDPGTGARLQLDGASGDVISIGPVSILR